LANYPYVYNSGTLKKFIQIIPDAATPTKVTQEYLEAAGFKSKNDRAIIPVLKFIGFLSGDGTTTQDYALLRDKSQTGAVMASHIRKGYSELFGMFPDANDKPNEALRNFFATKISAGGTALGLIVSTFKTLCETADFGASAPVSAEIEEPRVERPISRSLRLSPIPESGGVTINLNIQLQLPPTEDASIYDKIFKSLKEHLIERKSTADA
jgi:hypothetical protein